LDHLCSVFFPGPSILFTLLPGLSMFCLLPGPSQSYEYPCLREKCFICRKQLHNNMHHIFFIALPVDRLLDYFRAIVNDAEMNRAVKVSLW
ncbi:hypothetical protein ACQP3L_34140, partial [Escherichia coli]